jgi:hypothetical protein
MNTLSSLKHTDFLLVRNKPGGFLRLENLDFALKIAVYYETVDVAAT